VGNWIGDSARAVHDAGIGLPPKIPGRQSPITGNQEVFNDYDMVVSISQRTINDQLRRLADQCVIPASLTLARQTDSNGEYVYTRVTPETVPYGAEFLNGSFVPQIQITATGTLVTLVLNFVAGTAGLLSGVGPLARLQTFDMTGWSYGLAVSLDLAAVASDDIAQGKGVPDLVRSQLQNFTSRMFDVRRLFLDLESVDLLRFDPATSSAGGAGPAGLDALTLFMQFYLRDLLRSGNPFVLGYSVTTNDRTVLPDDLRGVPDLLRPVGTTFTLYHEPSNPDLSNINFVLATKGGHGAISGTPRPFPANWLMPEQVDKVIYSHACLVEPLLIRPVFEQLRRTIARQIGSNIHIIQDNDYAVARSTTSYGFSFTISNVMAGDDQYTNRFTVVPSYMPGYASLTFQGDIEVYKKISKGALFCTAHGWAKGNVAWSGEISVTVANASLDTSHSFKTDGASHDSGTNSCADGMSWMGKITGGIVDVLSGFVHGLYFSNLFSQALSVGAPGIGDVSVAIRSLGPSVRGVIALPAGGLFEFDEPTIDAAGNLIVMLDYQPTRGPA
jgi:hypothetical protein